MAATRFRWWCCCTRCWAWPLPPGAGSRAEGAGRGAVAVYLTAAILAAALLPGIIELKDAPRRQGLFNQGGTDDSATIRWPPDVVVCDWEQLVGYYSMHPCAQWHGSAADPQLDQIASIRQAHGDLPAILGKAYLLTAGDMPEPAIGPYREFARFDPLPRTEVYVLYARPGEAVTRPD